MAVFEIPLSAKPQTFLIDLAGQTYRLTLKWGGPAECWVLDIADSSGSPIAAGLPVVTGVNILGQLDYLGIGGELRAQTLGDLYAPPSFDNLGTDGLIFFITP